MNVVVRSYVQLVAKLRVFSTIVPNYVIYVKRPRTSSFVRYERFVKHVVVLDSGA